MAVADTQRGQQRGRVVGVDHAGADRQRGGILVYAVSGEADLIAVLRTVNTARLDTLLDEIGEIGETDGVRKTTTSVVLAVQVDRGG